MIWREFLRLFIPFNRQLLDTFTTSFFLFIIIIVFHEKIQKTLLQCDIVPHFYDKKDIRNCMYVYYKIQFLSKKFHSSQFCHQFLRENSKIREFLPLKIAYFAQCLKITEKVAFNIASEASYVYILSRQKFIKNAENGQFSRFF